MFVFDKDGLLFQSLPFWRTMAHDRARALSDILTPRQTEDWFSLMSVAGRCEDGTITIDDVSETGIFAVASPMEEIAVTAAFLTRHANLLWAEARQHARIAFQKADEAFDPATLKPHKGFPDVFKRLQKAGIPYGIATSDIAERAIRSVDLFDSAEALSFIVTPVQVENGKPAADMLEWIARRTGMAMERIAVVGDSIVDMEMAKAAGALGFGIPERDSMRALMQPVATAMPASLDEIRPC